MFDIGLYTLHFLAFILQTVFSQIKSPISCELHHKAGDNMLRVASQLPVLCVFLSLEFQHHQQNNNNITHFKIGVWDCSTVTLDFSVEFQQWKFLLLLRHEGNGKTTEASVFMMQQVGVMSKRVLACKSKMFKNDPIVCHKIKIISTLKESCETVFVAVMQGFYTQDSGNKELPFPSLHVSNVWDHWIVWIWAEITSPTLCNQNLFHDKHNLLIASLKVLLIKLEKKTGFVLFFNCIFGWF